MRYKWILFDLDNTLLDFDAAERGALGSTFEEIGRPYLLDQIDTYHEINHLNWQAYERGEITQSTLRTRRFEMFFERLGVPDQPIPASERYHSHLRNRTDLVEGAVELLEALQGRVRMMIITNGLKDVQRSRLGQSEIGRFFSDIVISDEVGSAKPDGRIFDASFELMGCPQKSDVLIVGDSLTSDMQGGLNYGIDTCWFNPRKRPNGLGLEVGFEIGRLDSLLPLLE